MAREVRRFYGEDFVARRIVEKILARRLCNPRSRQVETYREEIRATEI
jgi:hypothetical protein